MLHIIQTRYSVYHPYPKKMPKSADFWNNVGVTEEDFEQGEHIVNKKGSEFLYSDGRMAHKFHCFKYLTLPTVQAAMDKVENAEWWIYVSPSQYFPAKHLNDLVEITKSDERIKIIEFDFLDGKYLHFGDHAQKELAARNLTTRFSTTRIDDDDGFYSDLLYEVETTALGVEEPFVYVSTWGVKCEVLPDGSLKEGPLWEHQNGKSQHAVGLVAVDEHVMRLGNHGQIQNKWPNLKIIRNRKKRKAFFLSCHVLYTCSSRTL